MRTVLMLKGIQSDISLKIRIIYIHIDQGLAFVVALSAFFVLSGTKSLYFSALSPYPSPIAKAS